MKLMNYLSPSVIGVALKKLVPVCGALTFNKAKVATAPAMATVAITLVVLI